MDEVRNVPKSSKVTLSGNVTTSAYACTSHASAAGVLVPPGERVMPHQRSSMEKWRCGLGSLSCCSFTAYVSTCLSE